MKNFIKIVSLLLVLALFILPGCSGCNPETSSSMKTSQVTSKSSTKTKSYQVAGCSGCIITSGETGKVGGSIDFKEICPYCGKECGGNFISVIVAKNDSYSGHSYCYNCRRTFDVYISWIIK